MRFLVDECTGPVVADWLRDNGHEVYSVFDEDRGMADDDVIRKALSENWILITNRLHGAFIVVTEKQVRFAKSK
jgi:predicted nuclease of predicted toxin-antitoxin system